jgi:phosphoserine phosphatase
MHQLIFENFLKDQDINFLKKNVEPFLNCKIKKLLNPIVYQLLQKHLLNKDLVILMSSSPNFLVEGIAKMLQIEHCFSTKYKIVNGKINSIECFVAGDFKLKCLKEFLKKNEICFDRLIAFSDSINDLALLEFCDEIYLVKPKKNLKEKLNQKSYKIL